MTPLGERIRALIAAQGPITVADYMALCLFDPDHGYYTNRDPFGRNGDFVTAPEISQMFGELVGAWVVSVWRQMGSPEPVTLAEIGPGRGTLMQDMVRTIRQIDPKLLAAADVALIETSPHLRTVQRKTLAPLGLPVVWHGDPSELKPQPLILVGNELFDAVPIHQYVKLGTQWRERMVALDEDGALQFVAGAGSLDEALLPPDAPHANDGAIVELAPARTAIMGVISHHVATHGGAALFFDYGYFMPGTGDTLQALRKHEFDDVLAAPGEADLTTHVDFSALAETAHLQGLTAKLTTQGSFLLQLGLLERAGQLGQSRDEAGREELRETVERLAGPEQMGELFKVLAIVPPGIEPPGFVDSQGN